MKPADPIDEQRLQPNFSEHIESPGLRPSALSGRQQIIFPAEVKNISGRQQTIFPAEVDIISGRRQIIFPAEVNQMELSFLLRAPLSPPVYRNGANLGVRSKYFQSPDPKKMKRRLSSSEEQ